MQIIRSQIVCGLLCLFAVGLINDTLAGNFLVAGEWRSLFNGRDLSGWEVVDPDGGGWQVVDGELRTAGAGGWLSTTEQFADFEFELEFNLADGSNSGVFFRTPRQGRASRTGNEIQLIDDATMVYGPLEPWQLSGSLYHVQAARPGGFTKAGQWQQFAMRAVGRELEVRLNGKSVVTANLDDYPQLVAEHPGLSRSTGYLGLQNYGGRPISFRNIRVRTLPE